METKPKEKITAKPRTAKELAEFYSVHPVTLKKWLKDETINITPKGYYYSIKQVKQIVDHLGEP